MDSSKDRFYVIDYETTGIGEHDVPIEVGIMVTDADWNHLDSASSFIASEYASGLTEEAWKEAQDIHGIEQDTIRFARPADRVAVMIKELSLVWRPKDEGRLILLSDNIQFEWQHTQWVLEHIGLRVQDLFHYCGWDTSILTKYTSFKDPSGTRHRALSDVQGLVEELQRVSRENQ